MYLSLKKQSVDAIDIPSLMHYLICVDKVFKTFSYK